MVGAGLRDRDRLGRAAVVGFVDAHLAEVVQQRRGLELRRARDARSRASLPIATASVGDALGVTVAHHAAELGRGAERADRLVVRAADHVEVLVRVPGREQRDGEHRRAPEAHAAAARRRPGR